MNAVLTNANRVVVSVPKGYGRIAIATLDAAARKLLPGARVVSKVSSNTHTLRIYAA